jgi:7-cyano-7-deazaguanine synthase
MCNGAAVEVRRRGKESGMLYAVSAQKNKRSSIPKTALVLHSGGLDSTVCLLLARSYGLRVISFGVDYGQRHHVELQYAATQCSRFRIQRHVVQVAWDKPVRDIPLDRKRDSLGKDVSPAFLPGRNGVFLMLACAEAAGVGADEVWIGVNSIDFSGYPDCKPEFIAAFKAMLRRGFSHPPKILAPLQRKSKPAIAEMARGLGLTRTDTWSCYRPQVSSTGLTPCARCDACVLHEYAWSTLATSARNR